MASKVIPKEQLTAYQRWELAAFDEPGESGVSVDEPVQLQFPTAEELEQIQQSAWQEGFDQGLAEGREKGLASGKQEGYEAGHKEGFDEGRAEGAVFAERLRDFVNAVQIERLREDEAIANEILMLSLKVAQQIVGTSLRVKPEQILVVIREALQSLPSLSGHHRVVVHPDYGTVVRDWFVQEHGHIPWKIVEDDTMQPGGFRFESAHSELDASMQTRWREIVAALGADPEWMD